MPVWQAPSFLFIVMGVVIVVIMSVVYLITQKYDAPEVLILSEIAIVTLLFTVGNFIIQSIEQMAKTNKMKSEFVSIASHQLKGPLAQINWEVELLLAKNREGLNEKQCAIIKRIADSNERMARLVNDLLDVARIDQGSLVLNQERFDLLQLVKKVVENNRFLAKANNVEIEIVCKENQKIVINGDRRRIGIVLDNLLSNAIKYINRKGLVKIKIVKKKHEVLVSVKDNGIGIPLWQQDNVFEKFFRSANASRYQITGTGLGLYISKNFVEKSGGKMWFKSEENKGSEFFFTLPLEDN